MKKIGTAIVCAAGWWGCAALGDDHNETVDCFFYPAHCQGECAELNACLSGEGPIGGGVGGCSIEYSNLRVCELSPPPGPPPIGPPGTVIILPPACPAGQQYAAGECQYVCGDDEAGGGDTPCEPCGEGEVPNPEGDACVECEYGEYKPGECATECTTAALDLQAASLRLIGQDPWEVLIQYTCDSQGAMHEKTIGTTEGMRDRCSVVGSEPPPTISALGHSHPFFRYPHDRLLYCGRTMLNGSAIIDEQNEKNRKFSPDDKIGAKARDRPLYLVVPRRNQVRGYRKVLGIWKDQKVWPLL